MKIPIQYVNDSSGQLKAVLISVTHWDKIVQKVKKYEQLLKLKSDLTEAFQEVEEMRKGKKKEQTLSEFLNEL